MSEPEPSPAPNAGFGSYFNFLEQQAAEGRAAIAAEQVLPSGWANDAGAFGELVLDVASRSVSGEHHWRYDDSE